MHERERLCHRQHFELICDERHETVVRACAGHPNIALRERGRTRANVAEALSSIVCYCWRKASFRKLATAPCRAAGSLASGGLECDSHAREALGERGVPHGDEFEIDVLRGVQPAVPRLRRRLSVQEAAVGVSLEASRAEYEANGTPQSGVSLEASGA